jgi:carbonic anhydrase
LDAWLTPLKVVRRENAKELEAIKDATARQTRMAELGVERGVSNLMSSMIVEDAIKERGLTVHGVLFDVACGKLLDLGVGTNGKGGKAAGSTREEEKDLVKGNHGMLVFGGEGAKMAIR